MKNKAQKSLLKNIKTFIKIRLLSSFFVNEEYLEVINEARRLVANDKAQS